MKKPRGGPNKLVSQMTLEERAILSIKKRAWRLKKLSEDPTYFRRLRISSAEKTNARMYKYRKNNPWRHKANRLVCAALKRGDLKKLPCEVCGSPRTQAHHDSYYPEHFLSIRWLCNLHHAAWHRLFIFDEPEEKICPDFRFKDNRRRLERT